MSAWVLPDHLADALPSEARHIEELRRSLLDAARGYGYELVMPPLLEYLDSLLTGTGQALQLQTFKLVDQLSGRTLGLRADTTPQVARIDAHLLNRSGVTRLCYCGSVLHTQSAKPHATREPLQFGAEVYGHAGIEADLEAMLLAVDCLQQAGFDDLCIDLSDASIVRSLLGDCDAHLRESVYAALAAKDASGLQKLAGQLQADVFADLQLLMGAYGAESTVFEVKNKLKASQNVREALSNLKYLADHLKAAHPALRVSFDLADVGGYAYYTGAKFALYSRQAGFALARGGRYDEVGSVFGRKRPAVGFSLDVKELVSALPKQKLRSAILAPWGEDVALKAKIAQLRAAGEVVVCMLPGHENEVQEFHCDRTLVSEAGAWVIDSI